MLLNSSDLAYLLDIHECCLEIISFTKGIKYYHFERNKMAIRAVERSLGIIGEASNKLSSETRDQLPHIPWRKIIGLRNRIVHEYRDIIIFRTWEIAKKDIPVLFKQLKKIEQLKKFID